MSMGITVSTSKFQVQGRVLSRMDARDSFQVSTAGISIVTTITVDVLTNQGVLGYLKHCKLDVNGVMIGTDGLRRAGKQTTLMLISAV